MDITDIVYQVSGINIGPVHKKDVMRAASMLEKAKELAVILCFDVPVDKEAEKLADELGIKIFKGIYYLLYFALRTGSNRFDLQPTLFIIFSMLSRLTMRP